MRICTCSAGVSLMEQGKEFWGWELEYFDVIRDTVIIEVPETALQGSPEDGYKVIKPELATIVEEDDSNE